MLTIKTTMAPNISQSWIFSTILILITLLNILKPTFSLLYLNSVCPNTTMFADNSKYKTNLDKIFNYLASNATNPTGFYQALAVSHTTKHNKNDTVYGQFLCRGDLNASACQDCVTTATTTDLPKTFCPNRKNAIIWYEECMVQYSNQAFFGKLNEQPKKSLYNTQNVTGNVTQFEELVGNMLKSVVTVRAASGGSHKKFSTDAVKFTSNQTVYGMGQCTPDLSGSDCKKCLKNSISEMKESQGGRVLGPNCIVRYEMYAFFNLSSISPELLSPAPQPSLPVEPPSPQQRVPPANEPMSSPPEVSTPSPQLLPPPPQVLPPSSQRIPTNSSGTFFY